MNPNDEARPLAVRPITMSNTDAISILEKIETDIYGKIAIAKAIDALLTVEVEE